MTVKDLQLTIEREKWPRYEAAQTGNTAASKAAKLQKIVDDYQARNPDGVPEVSKDQPGPVLREAMKFAEALRKLRAGQSAQAMSPDVHKLAPFVVPSGGE